VRKTIRDVLLIGLDGAMHSFIKKYYDLDLLPNIGKLIENGVFGEALPCPPTDTPTNWTTIATGATTATHGVTSFYIHIPGEPYELGQKLRSRGQLSKYCKAEYIWSKADQYSIPSLVLNYPAGWPGKMENGYVCLYSWPMPESTPRILDSSREYTINFSKDEGSINLMVNVIDKFVENSAYIKLVLDRSETSYILYTFVEGKRINIRKDGWSDWISIKVNIRASDEQRISIKEGLTKCLFKLKLLDITENYIKIMRSEVITSSGWIDPTGFEEELVRNTHYIGEEDILIKPSEKLEYDIFGEEAKYLVSSRVEAHRLTRIASFFKKKIGWRLCYLHYHLMDGVNHRFLGYLDPSFPYYNEEKAEYVEKYFLEAYRIIDEFIGLMLRSVATPETLVILVSDHAAVPAWRVINIRKILMDEGLLRYKKTNDTCLVDWSKTSVFPWIEPLMMWINLKGRDPQGIIDKEDYEDLRNKVSDILYNLRDPDTGKRIFTMITTREESVNIGLGDERTGDIVYFLNPPYTIWHGPIEDLHTYMATKEHLEEWLVKDQSRITGIHGYYLPNVKVKDFQNSSMFIINGPGIKKGITLKKMIRLIDIAPTISYLLGIRPPENSEGRILYEIME